MMVAHRAGNTVFGAKRTGAVVPLTAFMMVAMVGFLALAIDIGMLTISKTQAQNAADLAALTAARTLNGDSTNSYNQGLASTNACAELTWNNIIGQQINAPAPSGSGLNVTSGQLTLAYGSFDYSQSTQQFTANFPPTVGTVTNGQNVYVPTSAVQATVTTSTGTAGPASAFGGFFGVSNLATLTATAIAVHRPRDVAMIVDLSNSMRFGTLSRYDFYAGNGNTSNNPDTVYPTFMQYSSGSAAMQGSTVDQTSAVEGYTISPSNITTTTTAYKQTYVNSFFSNNAYASTLIRAFDSSTSGTTTTNGVTTSTGTWSAPSASASPQLPSVTSSPAQFSVTPGGDAPLFKSGSTTTYARNVNEVLGNSYNTSSSINYLWELDGYSLAYSGGVKQGNINLSGTTQVPDVWTNTDYTNTPFYGYTQGPGYYGKTFFIWPPNPRSYIPPSYNATTGLPNPPTAGSIPMNDSSGNSTLYTWLTNLGLATSDAKYLTSGSASSSTYSSTGPWNTWSLTTLQTWMQPASPNGTPSATKASQKYSTTGSGPYVSGSNNKAPTYCAVCRLYNRAYPAGGSSTTGISGVSYNPAFIADWRIRFFGTNTHVTAGDTGLFSSGSSYSLNVSSLNSGLGNSSGYPIINYNAILQWIQSTDQSGNAASWYDPNQNALTWTPSGTMNAVPAPPNPFPSQMRAGRIKYYGSIPTSIPSPVTDGNYPNFGGATGSYDARFWKECIDYMLGLYQSSANNYDDISQMGGYNSDFAFASTPSCNSAPAAPSPQYMDYRDNPNRGQMRYWFGPLMMVDYLANCNMYEVGEGNYFMMDPGDAYIAPTYSCKQGVQGAINTMQTNHPNDWFALMFYNSPQLSNGAASGANNCVACPLGVNYSYGCSSLYFPFSTISANGTNNASEVTPYDADKKTGNVPSSNFLSISRAYGSTSFAMGLMLAYNQFVATPTTDTNLRTFVSGNSVATFAYGGDGISNTTSGYGMAGGLGRKGAQKVIIFETDGMANYPVGDKSGSTYSTAPSGTLSGTGYSPAKYYQVRYNMNNPSGSEYPVNSAGGQQASNASNVVSQVTGIIQQMGGTANTGAGGDFGSTRNPFRLYAIGFGPVFSGSDALSATATLTSMQSAAGVSTAPTIVTGNDSQMISSMTTAFTNVLQNGIQIALVK